MKKILLIINIVFPIFIGAVIYYVTSPEVVFVQHLDSFFHGGMHVNEVEMSNPFLRFIRNYFMDFLWGYALVFALFFVAGNKTASGVRLYIIAILFSMVMEILQLTSFVNGTFDVADIVTEVLAETFAAFIIKKYFTWGGIKQT